MPPPPFQKRRQFSVFEHPPFKSEYSSTFLSVVYTRSPWDPPKRSRVSGFQDFQKNQIWTVRRTLRPHTKWHQNGPSQSMLFTTFAPL